MSTTWTIAALFALSALCALTAHARVMDVRAVGAVGDDVVDPYCLSCDENQQRYQLIRGDGEVQKCNDQIYCDCHDHKQKKCTGMITWGLAFNPDEQDCVHFFNCEKWLSGHPTPAPPTQPATDPSTSEPTTTEQTTEQSPPTQRTTFSPQTTDLTTSNTQTSEVTTSKPETTTSPTTTAQTPERTTSKSQTTKAPATATTPAVQSTTPSSAWANKATALTMRDSPLDINLDFDEKKVVRLGMKRNTLNVAVVSVAAAEAGGGAEDFCSRCDTSGLRYRLVRAEAEAGAEAVREAEVRSCEAGVYCDCDREHQERCFLWMLGRRFNEEAQRCEFSFDCRAWQANHQDGDGGRLRP
ncbi:Collagen alpha-1(XXVII) chain A [Frankliniella fusca]|uniref:Collagen alpha-1(XXVII) chain A n=1 Tax=Frankliniella fusca TaxID=407009 RepID=A0AAE1GUK3_9NEOP|nr:Collagen alpha-1(XXVII) chain A [Frankliniella fusca]